MSSHSAPNLILQIRTRIPPGLPPRDILAGRLVEAVHAMMEKLPIRLPDRDIELGMTLTDDNGIRIVNRAHRQIDAPTDVLSFPLVVESRHGDGESEEELKDDYPDGPPVALGDIVISLETVERQAAERCLPLHERFAECLVHAMLHIAGCEHSTEPGREEMESMEDELVPEVARLLIA